MTLYPLYRFHWKSRTQDIQAYWVEFITCEQHQDSCTKSFRGCYPSSLPDHGWGSVAMDSITHLSRTTEGLNAVTTMVDRFSPSVHFSFRRSWTVRLIRTMLSLRVFWVHGGPDSMILYRNAKRSSAFWKQPMTLCDVKLRTCSRHQPQKDGLSETMHGIVKTFFRCFINSTSLRCTVSICWVCIQLVTYRVYRQNTLRTRPRLEPDLSPLYNLHEALNFNAKCDFIEAHALQLSQWRHVFFTTILKYAKVHTKQKITDNMDL